MSKSEEIISIVIPILNERENVRELVHGIQTVMVATGERFEIILVDDGSTDGTVEELAKLQTETKSMRVIQLRRNFGQTAAMAAGFDHARGTIIVPMDGDLQNDPADIPRLVAKIREGYDVVSGWRRDRQDKLFTRKVPSWAANRLIGFLTGVKLHDYGCSLKAYHRDIINQIHLYGEMHRFIPAIASWSGARVAELEVNHRPRTRGRSKYGLNRIFKVLLDLMTVKFLGDFSTKPLHIFGGIGFFCVFLAMVSGCLVLYQKYVSPLHLAMNRNPLLILTTLLIIMSVQFFLMGLLAEMLARTYHESQKKPVYVIRRILPPPGGDAESDSR